MKRINTIKKSTEFKYIIENGDKYKTPYFNYYLVPKKEKYYRIGISVPKKLGKANLRNKLKRQVRHIITDLAKDFNFTHDCIIIINSNFIDLDFNSKIEMLNNLNKHIGDAHENK